MATPSLLSPHTHSSFSLTLQQNNYIMSLRSLIPLARMATRTTATPRIASMTHLRFNSTVVSSTPPASLNEGEKHLYSKLFEKFQPTKLIVEDISGKFKRKKWRQ